MDHGDRDQRLPLLLARLARAYPDAQCSLKYSNPFQLLIATMLSAQCTDERVNAVSPALFRRYPDARAVASAPIQDLEEAIRSTGFFRTKARNMQAACRLMVLEFGGEVPASMEQLLRLQGVARKTANVVLGNAFGLVEGVVVDTHVGRISRRLGLTTAADPVKIEQDLMAVLPRTEWLDFNHRLIYFGRAICKAPRPLCQSCFMADLCPSAFHEGV